MVDPKRILDGWLRIRGAGHGRLTAKERSQSELGLRVLFVLQQHAPGVATLQRNACWEASTQAAIDAALKQEFGSGQAYEHAHDLIASAIRKGRDAGLWRHAPWTRLRRARPVPSMLTTKLAKMLGTSIARRDTLIARLPAVLQSDNARVVAGALLVAAADLSAILLPGFLHQILDPARPIERHGELAWMDLDPGSAHVDASTGTRRSRKSLATRNVRRWFPDEVSLLLLARYQTLAKRALDPAPCLAAYCKFAGLEVRDPSTLLRTATADWTTRLPALFITFAQQPILAPSLPRHAWARLLVDRPLPGGAAPMAPRQQAASAARRRQADANARDGIDRCPAAPPHDALSRQIDAVTALTQTLARSVGEPLLDAATLKRRLDLWDRNFGDVDGWPRLMHAGPRDMSPRG